MASSSRSSRLQQFCRALGQRYQVVSPGERPVLELVLYAVCLDGASHAAAEQAIESVVKAFYDFNEARVSSTQELSEQLSMLPDPRRTAERIKSVLQTLFETTYTFDMESLRKPDTVALLESLRKYSGLSPFSVMYVVQQLLHQGGVPASEMTFRLLKPRAGHGRGCLVRNGAGRRASVLEGRRGRILLPAAPGWGGICHESAGAGTEGSARSGVSGGGFRTSGTSRRNAG
ncbi:MAG: hypothetical protein Q4C47_03245 [Planctomycetia bacterium]|nr:hypothetical protein [Planctomycetia bacterium]